MKFLATISGNDIDDVVTLGQTTFERDSFDAAWRILRQHRESLEAGSANGYPASDPFTPVVEAMQFLEDDEEGSIANALHVLGGTEDAIEWSFPAGARYTSIVARRTYGSDDNPITYTVTRIA